VTPAEIARRLTARELWCIRAGSARYGTRWQDWTAIKARGLAYAHDNGAARRMCRGRPVGRWTWRLTPLGREVRAIIEQEARDGR